MVWLPALMLTAHVTVLVFELAVQRHLSPPQHAVRWRLRSMVALALGEMLVAWRTFGWDQPFRHRRIDDSLRPDGVHSGLVLLHGLYCNRGVWNPWMDRLRRQGVPFIALTLEPPFASIDDYAPAIHDAVRRLNRATGRKSVIVAHSMGGIAARAWLAALDGGFPVHGVVTVGSPHAGTWFSRFSRATNARQMGLGSAWLDALAARESPSHTARFTCFFSDCDNVVVPWTNARLPGADNRLVASRPHLALLGEPAIFEEALRLARAAPAH